MGMDGIKEKDQNHGQKCDVSAVSHCFNVFLQYKYFILVYLIDSVGGFMDNICNISVMVVIHRREGG